MTFAEQEISTWLDTIEDADDRAATFAAFAIATDCEPEEDAETVFTPFVYPH